MDLSDLSREQAEAVVRRLVPTLGYLTALTDRMQKRAWRASDPAYVAAANEKPVRGNCSPAAAGTPSSANELMAGGEVSGLPSVMAGPGGFSVASRLGRGSVPAERRVAGITG